ncbi:hypothetical protein ACVWZD_003638 [Streptomyces sp. TE3672]
MIAPLPLKWLWRTGWLYSTSEASGGVVTALQPSDSAGFRAAVTISCSRSARSRSARSRSRRGLTVMPEILAELENLPTLLLASLMLLAALATAAREAVP